MTNQELLTKVETAISNILDGGQDVTLADKRLINARLDTLNKMRDDYIKKLSFSTATQPARNSGLIKR